MCVVIALTSSTIAFQLALNSRPWRHPERKSDVKRLLRPESKDPMPRTPASGGM